MKLPLGFRYAATYAGIRKQEKDDLVLIVSDTPASAAAVFTTNRVQAAPVVLARRHLEVTGGRARAILANAGNANCATRTGARVALACCRAAARELKIPVAEVIPASTGVIGVELDARLILNALPGLCASLEPGAFARASLAILTTDTVPKTAFAEVGLDSGAALIAAMTKGSGMIQPLMATTLGFVMTDAVIAPRALQSMLRWAVERSYNRLSVDGDTSTNDMVLILANGASGLKPSAQDLPLFREALTRVLGLLAEQIARDGEGAKKKVTILVSGAASEAAAVRIGRAIANSPLVKTAIAGSDPNWGRILSAAGNSGVPFDPAQVDISLQGVRVCRGGLAAPFDESGLKTRLDAPDCSIQFSIRRGGPGRARFYTCDLTHGYIDINASYRT